MQKIVIITGQTASGKSKLGVQLAKEFNGEIISADSVQIYKQLNIGSAKDPIEERLGVEHHLIDIKEPTENYNVGEFITDCKNAIENIISKGKTPFIVGGSAMYIKALMEGFSLGGANANIEFRKHYENMAKEIGNVAVWNELNALNPSKAQDVHPNNLKRVIRYLEIEKFGNNTPNTESILKDYKVCAVGIVADRDTIYNKINKRTDIMLDMGLEEEVTNLYKQGITRDMQSVTSICYREWFDYFEGKIDKNRVIELIKQHCRNYAKRQLTFLKTMKNIEILTYEQADKKIRSFLND